MHTETRYNGVSDVLVLVADNDKLIRRKGTESVAEEVYLGISYFVDGVRQDPPHQDVPEDFEEVDRPGDWPEPEPYVDHEVSNEQALNIILNGE